ncbi:LytTR family DNA-binding domain-containing protein [Telluribacter sp. SYSU D00476]|uniref:LytR/AlgR family response regulator transcription factor n=1 Tax=Telluribacter sp. SYSU D00476 TaxID=2811430 RepID=UPI001FF36AF6|nr:LytTR family DNA-binding domain-containing protein [Telluribacter sp. SYSU D00476]
MESVRTASAKPAQQDPFPFPTQDIIVMKGSGNYTEFIPAEGRSILTCRPLLHYQSLLPDNFLRVHKGYIINLCHVESVFPEDKAIYMDNGHIIVVSRLKWPQVKDLLQQYVIKSVA